MSENHVLTVVSLSVSETERIGGLIGTCLQPGMTIALNGTLGAGKTNLVQAIAESLSIDQTTDTFGLADAKTYNREDVVFTHSLSSPIECSYPTG